MDETMDRINQLATERHMLYHLAGHELHHLEIIKEKYLSI